jgi:hypothetical protein
MDCTRRNEEFLANRRMMDAPGDLKRHFCVDYQD